MWSGSGGSVGGIAFVDFLSHPGKKTFSYFLSPTKYCTKDGMVGRHTGKSCCLVAILWRSGWLKSRYLYEPCNILLAIVWRRWMMNFILSQSSSDIILWTIHVLPSTFAFSDWNTFNSLVSFYPFHFMTSICPLHITLKSFCRASFCGKDYLHTAGSLASLV